MDIIPLAGMAFAFITSVTILSIVIRGPKAKAKAEIMKAEALARLEGQRTLISAVNNEELVISANEQKKRIDELEEEVAFLRKVIEKKN
jgi:hypothetical protein